MRTVMFILMVWLPGLLLAQRPTHIPFDKEPLRLFESPFNIIFYIVIPLLILFLYVIWRRKIRKEQEEKKNQQSNRE